MNVEEFKEDLSNQLRDQLRGVEMNITNSFLNGKICSPLLMGATDVSSAFLNRATQTLGLLNQAGLYINEDGIEVDPHMVTDAIEKFISTSMGLVTGEMLKLKDHVVTEILKVPDTSIIMEEAKTIMWKKIEKLNLGDMLEFDLYFDYEEDNQQRQTKTINDAISKFTYFCNEKVPKVTQTITYWENRIASEMNNISCYIAFGPDWVIEKATYYAQFGFDFVESYIDTALNEVNQFKEDVFRGAGQVVGGLMAAAFDKLIVENMKHLRNEKGKLAGKLNNEKYAKLQKGMINIMNKLGVKVDVPQSMVINKDMIRKIQNDAKIANIIKGFTADLFVQEGEDGNIDVYGNVVGKSTTGVVVPGVSGQQSSNKRSQLDYIELDLEGFLFRIKDGKTDKKEKGLVYEYLSDSKAVYETLLALYDKMSSASVSSADMDTYNEDLEKIETYIDKALNFYKFFDEWIKVANNFIKQKNTKNAVVETNLAEHVIHEYAEKAGGKINTIGDLQDAILDISNLFTPWISGGAIEAIESYTSKYSNGTNGPVL